jgi:hypothetical protein
MSVAPEIVAGALASGRPNVPTCCWGSDNVLGTRCSRSALATGTGYSLSPAWEKGEKARTTTAQVRRYNGRVELRGRTGRGRWYQLPPPSLQQTSRRHGHRDGRQFAVALCAAVLSLLVATGSCPSATHAASAPSATPCPWEKGHDKDPRGGSEVGMTDITPPTEDRQRWCHASSPTPQPGGNGHTGATSAQPGVSSSAPPQTGGNSGAAPPQTGGSSSAVPQRGASSGAAPLQPVGNGSAVPQPPRSRSAEASGTSLPDGSLLRSRPRTNAPSSGIWPIGSILLIVLGVALAGSTLFRRVRR